MTLALIFDVETTGLLPKTTKDEIPHIIQLSFALYDIETNRMVQTYNAFVKTPEGVIVKPFISELTGITQEKLEDEGVDVLEAIGEFHRAYQMADIIVAHNLQFDTSIIIIEVFSKIPELKGMFDWQVLEKTNKHLYCTMQESIDLCKIERTNSRGTYYKKPKLVELYAHFFGKEPENLHNSAVDVAVCLRCFLKMRYEIEVTDEAFHQWISS